MDGSKRKQADRAERGHLQREIWSIVLSRPECTVRDVHDVISERRPIAYSTILTVMTRMVERGMLVRRREGNRGIFRVAEKTDPEAAGVIIDQLIGQFGTVAASEFVSRARSRPEVLQQLRQLLEED